MLSKFSIIFLIVFIFVHIVILTKLIYSPYPELFVYPYLTNHNLKPYSQILDQHFPGLLFLPLNFDNLGLKNESIARVWSMGVIILTHFLLFIISSKILKNRKEAILVNFLYLLWQPFFEGWVLWIDSFLPLLLLPSFYLLIKGEEGKGKNWFFLAGLFLGLAIVFKQVIIPLSIMILVFLFFKTRNMKIIFRFILGLSLPVVCMILYLWKIGVLADFWYWTIVFNLTIYAKFGTSTPPSLGFITRVLFVYLSSIFAWFNKDKKLVQLLFIFLLGSLIGVFDRANFIHYQPSLPFAILATSLGVYQLNRKNIFKVLILIYLFVSAWWLNIFYKGHISSKVFFFDEQTKLIATKIKQYTKDQDKIFIFGAPPNLYQMSVRLPAGDIFVFQFPWFLKIAGERILAGIERDKPEIVVSDESVVIEGQSITNFARNIDQYIQENYEIIDQVGTTYILRRKKD